MTGLPEKKIREILPSSLLGKFLAVLLPVVMVVIGLGLGVTAWLIWQTEANKLANNMDATASSFAAALSVPVWTFETSAQTSILESILLDPNIVSVEIVTGQDVLTRTSTTTPGGNGDIDIFRPIRAPFDIDREIGTFAIVYTNDLVVRNVMVQIGFSAMLLIILVLAVVVASVLAQRRTIGQPLRSFLTAIRNSGRGQVPQPVDWSSRDEMGKVIKSYNSLVKDLRSERQHMIDNESRLSRQNESFKAIAGVRPANPDDPGDVLDMIANMIPAILDVPRVGIWGFDPHDTGLAIPILQCRRTERGKFETLPSLDSAGELFADLQQGKSIASENWHEDDRFVPVAPYLSTYQVTSLIYVPVMTEGELSGLLTIEETNRYRHWAKDELNYVDAVAAAIASLFIAQNRHRAEIRAEEKTGLLETAIHAMPGGFCLIDNNMKVAVINGRVESLLGLPKNSIHTGMLFTDFLETASQSTNLFSRYLDSDPETTQTRLLQGLGKRESVPREIIVNGNRHVEIKASSRPDGGFVLVLNDISLRKAAEKSLIRARDKAENATRAKSAFLAAMSHELRTPMNGVLGMLDILKRSPLNDDQQQTTAIIRDSADTLLHILNDILDFSKIEAERMEMETVPFSLRQVTNSVCASIAPAVAEKSLEMLLWIDESIPDQLSGDPVRMRQVLQNLVGNAVKFTDTGHVSLSITPKEDCHSPNSGHQSLLIRIEDTGIGIDEQRLPDLFEAFTQAESSTTRRYGGTGLGLTICKRILDLMGGTISAESEPGAGSRFDISLTLPVADTSPAPHMARSGQKIAVITENEGRRRSFAYALSLGGYDVLASGLDIPVNADVMFLDMAHPQAAKIITATSQAKKRLIIWNPDSLAVEPKPHTFSLVPAYLCGSELAHRIASILEENTLSTDQGPEQTAPPAEPETQKNAGHPENHILLVEDHSTNQMVIRQQLEILGYVITVSDNGLEALEELRRNAFRLVVTDCHMPYMDGPSLTRFLRHYEENHALPAIPVIALTANALPGEREACLEAGMTEFITKPVVINDLESALSGVINNSRGYKPCKYDALEIPAQDTPEQDKKENHRNPLERLAPRPRSTQPQEDISDETIDKPVLDVHAIATLFADDPAGPATIYTDFLGTNSSLIDMITSLAERPDRDKLKLAAHRLKGSAGISGARQLQAIAHKLEHATEDAPDQDLQAFAEQVSNSFERTRTAMTNVIKFPNTGHEDSN